MEIHSLFLAELISPRGRHGQGGLVLESFLRMVKFPKTPSRLTGGLTAIVADGF